VGLRVLHHRNLRPDLMQDDLLFFAKREGVGALGPQGCLGVLAPAKLYALQPLAKFGRPGIMVLHLRVGEGEVRGGCL